MTNQFHYYRITSDHRILWGGYDAIYHYDGNVRPSYDQRPATFELLARSSSRPSLSSRACASPTGGVGRSTPARRFCAFFGEAYGGRAAYALG